MGLLQSEYKSRCIMGEVMIRKATHGDVEKLVELGFLQYAEERAFTTGLNFSYMHTSFGWHYLIDHEVMGMTFVSEDEGVICGFYTCHFSPSGNDHTQIICHEVAWYVHPFHRSKGVGKALLKACQKEALSRKVTMHKVGTAVDTDKVLGLGAWYEKMGYTPFQTEYFKILTEEDVKDES